MIEKENLESKESIGYTQESVDRLYREYINEQKSNKNRKRR